MSEYKNKLGKTITHGRYKWWNGRIKYNLRLLDWLEYHSKHPELIIIQKITIILQIHLVNLQWIQQIIIVHYYLMIHIGIHYIQTTNLVRLKYIIQ